MMGQNHSRAKDIALLVIGWGGLALGGAASIHSGYRLMQDSHAGLTNTPQDDGYAAQYIADMAVSIGGLCVLLRKPINSLNPYNNEF